MTLEGEVKNFLRQHPVVGLLGLITLASAGGALVLRDIAQIMTIAGVIVVTMMALAGNGHLS